MATWALSCAERVLPLFEEKSPNDNGPRDAIKVGREWVETGIFKMSIIRQASLDAHASAKDAKDDNAACYAAHAAGQAVATAHVPQHAYGGEYYALKALVASNPNNQESVVAEELKLAASLLPQHLRDEIMKRFIITVQNGNVKIKLQKGLDY